MNTNDEFDEAIDEVEYIRRFLYEIPLDFRRLSTSQLQELLPAIGRTIDSNAEEILDLEDEIASAFEEYEVTSVRHIGFIEKTDNRRRRVIHLQNEQELLWELSATIQREIERRHGEYDVEPISKMPRIDGKGIKKRNQKRSQLEMVRMPQRNKIFLPSSSSSCLFLLPSSLS